MKSLYYILNKKTKETEVFNDSKKASVYLLGKMIDEFIFLKEDLSGVRILPIEKERDVSKIEYEMSIS